VVLETLGHANITVTLNIYPYVLPHMQDRVVDMIYSSFS
jgi:hypothetical protein